MTYTHNNESFEIYFVLNGLVDGEDGVYALTCGVGKQQPDGWYWLQDGMDDGIGPSRSRDDVIKAAIKAIHLKSVANEITAS